MDCHIIKDLIPLYIDDCCSEESRETVCEHISKCPQCRELYENMKNSGEITFSAPAPKKMSRINHWKASLLQSVLLFISFGIITVGVALEAGTPLGFSNGLWALNIVVPATGFMLSLANWYFIRLYKSRKSFSSCSLASTIIAILCAFVFTAVHYDACEIFEVLKDIGLTDFLEMLGLFAAELWVGFALTVIFCIISKTLSNKYAKMLGKE